MKNIFVILIVLHPIMSMAQLTFSLKGTIDKKISNELPVGTQIVLKEIKKETENAYDYKALVYTEEDEQYYVDLRLLKNISFSPTNTKEFWQHQALLNDVYENIAKKGLQYELRRELEDEAIEYINYVERNNLLFEDSYLESYLYALTYKVYPNRLDDGRPGILNVRILKDLSPNAFIFPNGSMFITTGLLSTINSEEELIGVLSHEISHFALDHSIININKAVQRQKRAEFWAAFATGVAMAADVYAASNNEYYAPGAITISTAILAYSVADAVSERMGIKYSQEQEMAADNSAVELMEFIKINPNALASALSKIKSNCILKGNYLALSGKGTHPSIDERIEAIGEPSIFASLEYDEKISLVNTFNAIIELNNQHLESCTSLAHRNIEADVATEEDYVILAMSTIYMYDTESKNKEALDLIKKAKSLNIYPSLNIPKQEGIILVRLGRLEEAKKSFEEYKQELDKEYLKLETIHNSVAWSNLDSYIRKEYEWTVKMINKVNKL